MVATEAMMFLIVLLWFIATIYTMFALSQWLYLFVLRAPTSAVRMRARNGAVASAILIAVWWVARPFAPVHRLAVDVTDTMAKPSPTATKL